MLCPVLSMVFSNHSLLVGELGFYWSRPSFITGPITFGQSVNLKTGKSHTDMKPIIGVIQLQTKFYDQPNHLWPE